ncbi:UDP-N-acetylmuramoyl-L-alanyl-D-glutamate--2,6-diaminopimelate ligase [Jeotgalibacillus sp. S-D1]|uniref:UDP-N-acetylmuramoyl-L-alanyl-D-glutamate--2, 6-diaminopimelate ligase n=1 Tax=Jeotgalibacillus sp. S-D1 TaxID=2552189 RepID=UPI00105A6330|nr:UDP-N-acetylmuramoyl-L-alanyl-D-glutamate--2,6-diaminopimelate ligase [Jeotgalibacillus sp. S-D1]TDL31429.1 UDP-N-acetylmuramoyl-L-alanyl-D-glutamate--2,6-diaminopimelate ligase [Jeotgalibacillus sp. S-D1]
MNIQDRHKRELGLLQQFGPDNPSITSIAFDSRNVTTGTAFFCIKGENADGHDYIVEAIEKGANVVIGKDIVQFKKLSAEYPQCTFMAVQDVRYAMAHCSIFLYDHADEKIQTIGVTGTNGKTTVAAFVRSLLTQLQIPTGSIGTNGIWAAEEKINFAKSTPTTPEAPDLHLIFRMLREKNNQAAVMEVSSIAVDQKRVEGIHFDIAIHTNLSPEHLEYHHTFERYKTAKMNLFKQAKNAVINIDDNGMGSDLLEIYKGNVLTYSLNPASGADVIAANCISIPEGTAFELIFKNRTYIVQASVYGDYNVANLLAAVCTGLHNGFTVEEIIPVLPHIENPSGRFQMIDAYGDRKIILDYAHTPVALENLIEAAKKIDHQKMIVMIAGIGIRDFEKMPKMAQAVEGKADEIIVTVDHPGYSNPKDIVNQVMTGFSNQNAPNISTSLTREEGVVASLKRSNDRDLIILTSGCINGAQLVKGEAIPHSDEDIIHHYFNDENEHTAKQIYELF